MYQVLGVDGKEYGPVDGEALRQWVAAGRANAQTRVKPEGASDWQPLASVPEFAALFSAAPAATPGGPPPAPISAPPTPVERKTSALAITSLVLGVLALPTCGITGLIGLVLGIVALVKINRSAGRLSGMGFAIAGICLSGVFLLMLPVCGALLLPALAKAKEKAQNITCMNNVRQLGLGVMMYSSDHGDKFPPANIWCDAILTNVGSSKVFICPSAHSDTRCDYAFNQKLDGLSMAKITNPSRTVMIFDAHGDWNANGGGELLAAPSRHMKRWIVGFVDGHVELLSKAQVDKLVWDP